MTWGEKHNQLILIIGEKQGVLHDLNLKHEQGLIPKEAVTVAEKELSKAKEVYENCQTRFKESDANSDAEYQES